MDYVVASALRRYSNLRRITISYDIACQWFTNLPKRLADLPHMVKPSPSLLLRPAVPKLHEPMHERIGHDVYSFNLMSGVGLTDGECIERIWANHNLLGNATKMQGPGSRQDTLDDHFGFWNWQKYVTMGKWKHDSLVRTTTNNPSQGATLMRRYTSAIADRNLQVEAHRGLTSSLPPDLLQKWEQMCLEWDNDTWPKTAENPYEVEGISEFFIAVLLVLSLTMTKVYQKHRSG